MLHATNLQWIGKRGFPQRLNNTLDKAEKKLYYSTVYLITHPEKNGKDIKSHA